MIKSHAYYTKLILSKISGLEDIAQWAGNHHETPAGNGYPEGIRGNQISIPERILSVCDVYHALTEQRTYRGPLPHSKAIEIMSEMVKEEKLCPDVFNELKTVIL